MDTQSGTLRIWIGFYSINGRPSYKTIETVYGVSEDVARKTFKVWQSSNEHLPHACAKWVPDAVILH